MNRLGRTTRVEASSSEIIEQHTGLLSDTLILAREACARIATDGLRQVEIMQEGKDYKISVRVRA